MISPRQWRPVSLATRKNIVLRPTAEPVSFADYSDYLRLKTTDMDQKIVDDKLRAARKAVENETRRAIVNQTWDLFIDNPPGGTPEWGIFGGFFSRIFGYDSGGFEIPRPPLIKVVGVYITDDSGTETTVDPSIYWVSRDNNPARIAQRLSQVWPDTGGRAFETFRVRFTAGYITPFTAVASNPTLTAPNHGFNVGDALVLTNRDGALPTGLAVDTNYYVVASNQTAGTLQVSATSGGSAIIPTTAGEGIQFLGEMPDNLRRAILAAAADDRFGHKEDNGSEARLPAKALSYCREEKLLRI